MKQLFFLLRQQQAGVIIFALSVFLLDLIFPLNFLRVPFDWSLHFTRPMQANLRQFIFAPPTIVRQIRLSNELITNLQSQNAQLRASQGELDILRQENEQLRAQLSSSTVSATPASKNQLSAKLFGNDDLTFIDKGLMNGVKEKDLLFVQQVLVGQVTKVDQYFSQVKLIKDGQLQIVARTIQGTSGLVSAQRGRLQFSEVASHESLQLEQNIFTLGSAEHLIPPDLYLGKVVEIAENPQNPTKTARLENGLENLSYTIVEVRGW